MAAIAAARNATSVLPKPTSPQMSRSMERPEPRSVSVSSIARPWSSDRLICGDDEPVHGAARAQIRERLVDRAALVLGLRIGKARAEFLELSGRRDHGLARPQLALGRDAHQLPGDLVDTLLGARLAVLP